MLYPISSIITIDGPTASGKGTISRLLAKKLEWHFLDSGALYRALAFAVLQYPNTDLDDPIALQKLIKMLKIDFSLESSTNEFDSKIIFQEIDISNKIRNEICSRMASELAVKPLVRKSLLPWQHEFYRLPGLVADGRDMGTVVFPNARLKIFLSASAEERAKRRFKQLKERGINVTLDAVLNDLLTRDKRDAERVIAPLKPASNAVHIDSTKLNIDEVLETIVNYLK
jgi:CMP/dCMP kinase